MNSISLIGERARSLLDYLQTAFWIIPACLLVFAGVLACITLWLDLTLLSGIDIGQLDWMNASDLQGVRSLLTATAAAILGVAGVSFSITIASLTLASQQFGPRLIRNFMQDRFIQTVLGVFVATFFYCMLSVQLSSVIADDAYSPLSTLLVVLVLTVINLLLLVFFIHHICMAIQADTVISDVAKEMKLRADTLFSTALEDAGTDTSAGTEDLGATAALKQTFDENGQIIESTVDGYIRAIDYAALMQYATDHNCQIRLMARAGDYIMTRSVIAQLLGKDIDENDTPCINEQIVVGQSRSPQQDLEYSIRQLVEVALRALSPGINDPFTAMSCIDRLGTLVNLISTRALPSATCADDDGKIRLLIDTTSFEGIVESAFNQIRQGAIGHVDVTIRLLDVIHDVAKLVQTSAQGAALLHQAELISAGVEFTDTLKHDEDAISERFDALQQTLASRFE